LEEEEHAFFSHQARDEVEVGLTILHAVFALGVLALVDAREIEIREAEIAEDLLDDVRDLLVLEDAAVGGTGQEPGPGYDLGPVVPIAVRPHRPGGEAVDAAVKEPRLPVRATEMDGDVL